MSVLSCSSMQSGCHQHCRHISAISWSLSSPPSSSSSTFWLICSSVPTLAVTAHSHARLMRHMDGGHGTGHDTFLWQRARDSGSHLLLQQGSSLLQNQCEWHRHPVLQLLADHCHSLDVPLVRSQPSRVICIQVFVGQETELATQQLWWAMRSE